ncbi:MAG: AEC family transporter [Rhodospirillales bacterium]|nr:AEC family transporter [Rhodospirillales bacterium]
MELTLGIVLPVFGLVLCGYIVGRTRLLTAEGIQGLTNFVFYVAIPVLMFRTVARNDLPSADDMNILAAYFGGSYLLYLGAVLIGRFIFRLPLDQLAIFGMGSVYGNTVMLGLPLVYAIYGEAGMLPLLIIISFHNPMFITLTALIVEFGRGQNKTTVQVIFSSLKIMASNPVVIAICLALPLVLLDWDLPVPVDRFCALLSAAAAPCALFALGASLIDYKIAGKLDESLTIVGLKLIAHPLIIWALTTYVFRLDPMWAAIATISAALPTGANVFIYASGYGIYVARATSATLISTGLSVVTVALLLNWIAN